MDPNKFMEAFSADFSAILDEAVQEMMDESEDFRQFSDRLKRDSRLEVESLLIVEGILDSY